MLYREIMVVCSQIHTKHINTLCGQNVELLNVQPFWYIYLPLCLKDSFLYMQIYIHNLASLISQKQFASQP